MWPQEVKREKCGGASPGTRGLGHGLSPQGSGMGQSGAHVVCGLLPRAFSPIPMPGNGMQNSLWFGGFKLEGIRASPSTDSLLLDPHS